MTGKGNTWRKKRRESNRSYNEGAVWIFTEGEKTEPNYLKALIACICKDPQYRKKYNLVPCCGSGVTVFEKAQGHLKKTISDEAGDIYVVFDKDDIDDSTFDELIRKIESQSNDNWKWHAIWSNESFELWYVLHFEYLCSDVGRKVYIEKLNKYFISHGEKPYGKSREDIYSCLAEIGAPEKALRNAEKLEIKWEGHKPSESIPCTKIRELLNPLIEKLPLEERSIFS